MLWLKKDQKLGLVIERVKQASYKHVHQSRICRVHVFKNMTHMLEPPRRYTAMCGTLTIEKSLENKEKDKRRKKKV